MKAKLIRTKYNKDYTLGTLFVYDDLDNEACFVETLELPWKENKTNISCIPTGEYKVVQRYTKKFGSHFHLLDVPGRKWILIHPANYVRELRGCIAPGISHEDIDGDGLMDVSKSRAAMALLQEHLHDEFKLEIL